MIPNNKRIQPKFQPNPTREPKIQSEFRTNFTDMKVLDMPELTVASEAVDLKKSVKLGRS